MYEDFDPMYLTLKVGETVPEEIDFEVFQNEEIKTMSFAELRGKWTILFFYPADFSFVCPTELGEMADYYEKFTAEGAEVVSVSTDTAFVHKAWHDQSDMIKKVQYPMASDSSHELSTMFGVINEDDGLAYRGTFIINPDGEIVCVEINSNGIGRSAKETLRKFKAAKYVGNNPANVCPASWDDGDDALTPGVDLVGKI
jgi:peroxiredoxin (alkyl hydroperoxide reductase subunit C)